MKNKNANVRTSSQKIVGHFWRSMSFVVFMVFTLTYGCSKSNANKQTDNSHSKDDSSGDDSTKTGSGINEGIAYMAIKKGTLLTYTIVSGDEAGAGSVVEYTDIHDSAGYQTANLQAVAAGIKVYSTVRHNKDYTECINSIAPVYYQLLQTLATSFTSFNHEEKPLVMRLVHKDPLNSEAFPTTVTATWHGQKISDDSKLDSKLVQTENKGIIDSSGTITTSAGTFENCIRVHYFRTQQRTISITSPTDNYKTESTAKFDIKIWMAKGIGPVKTLELNLDNGITTVTDLTKITHP